MLPPPRLATDDHRRWADRHARRLLGSLRRLLSRWQGVGPRRFRRAGRGRTAWNRVPPHVEDEIARLHVEHPQLGAGQLNQLVRRVRGFRLARETIRKILLRHGDVIAELRCERRRARRRIRVTRPRELWGADLTLVWLLGFFPVWILGVIDYHGSKLVALERVLAPTSAEVIGVLGRAFDRHGPPHRLLTDNGSNLTSFAAEAFLVERGVTAQPSRDDGSARGGQRRARCGRSRTSARPGRS